MGFKVISDYKNIIKAFFAFIFIYLILFISLHHFETKDYFYSDYKLYVKQNGEVEGLIVGSSLSRSLVPKLLCKNCYVLSYSSGDLEDAYRVIRDSSNISKIETVYFPINLFFFQRNRSKNSYEKVKEFSVFNSKLSDLISLLSEPLISNRPRFKKFIKEFVGLKSAIREKIDGRPFYETTHSLSWPNFEDYIQKSKSRSSLEYENTNISEKKWELLLSYLRENNIKLILFTPPFLAQYRRGVEDVVNYKHRQSMINYAIFQGAIYFDFSSLMDDEKYKDFFYDSIHLNDEGAELFTKVFKKALSKEQTR